MQEAGPAAATPLAEVLRRMRTAAGLSQEELARRAKVSTDAVSALERGTRTRPYPATIRALADAMLATPDEHAELLSAVPPRMGLRAHRPPRQAASPTGAMPTAMTPLVGRDADVQRVSDLIGDSSHRLVTLTGIGGVGKTRLALAVAERTAPSMPDGAVFAPLASVVEEALVLSEVARAVGITAAGGSSDSAGDIITAIRPFRMLLVLDNLEHLPGAANVVARLLASCDGISALVTSRARLGIRGETEYPVQPLTLPKPSCNAESLEKSPAANVLIERARALRPDLRIRPEDVPAIVAICHRVAGIPLALELAATGLRVLDPPMLVSRLDTVLQSAGVLVDLPSRQQTMRATLDYSYDLLEPSDRPLFRRVSVFVGGFTLDAAEALGGVDALQALRRLAEQSLVTVSSIDDSMRYGMLEPVAEYGRALLASADEADSAARAHATYYLEVAERAAFHFRREDQVTWFRLISMEDGNLSAALRWAIDTDQPEIAGRLAWALWMYWWMQGRLTAARSLLDEVLALSLPLWLRARVLVAVGAVTDPESSDAGGLQRLYEEALDLAIRSDDSEATAGAEAALGLAALRRRDFPRAERHMGDALAAASRAGAAGHWYADVAQVAIGAARRFQTDLSSAEAHISAGLRSARARGDRVTTCMALYNLGRTATARGQLDVADEQLREAAQLCAATRDAANLSYILDALAEVRLRQGRAAMAATLLGAAQAMRDAVPTGGHDYYGPDIEARDDTEDSVRGVLGHERYLRAFRDGMRADLISAVRLSKSAPSD